MKNYESKAKNKKLTAKEGYKYCAKCSQELPLFEFNMRTFKGIKKPFSYCKACEREYNRNKYSHVCNECGKTYKSGKKSSNICKSCYSKQVGDMGKVNLLKMDFTGSNNPMYGVRRFGKDNPNYNPNLTEEEREYIRNIPGYKEWIRAVYERDNYTCQCCGDNKGGNLNSHHIYGYAEYKELRTDIDNGICLCEDCHKTYHKQHGIKDNNWSSFKKFLLDNRKEKKGLKFVFTIKEIDKILQEKEVKSA